MWRRTRCLGTEVGERKGTLWILNHINLNLIATIKIKEQKKISIFFFSCTTWHVGPSPPPSTPLLPLARDQSQDPCSGSMGSSPLGCQESPKDQYNWHGSTFACSHISLFVLAYPTTLIYGYLLFYLQDPDAYQLNRKWGDLLPSRRL